MSFNVEINVSWTYHVLANLEFRISIGTSILLRTVMAPVVDYFLLFAVVYISIFFSENLNYAIGTKNKILSLFSKYNLQLLVTQRDGTPLRPPRGRVNVAITYTIAQRIRPQSRREDSPALRSIILPPRPIPRTESRTFSSRLYRIPKNGVVMVRFNHRRRKIPRRAANVNIRVCIFKNCTSVLLMHNCCGEWEGLSL